MFDDYPPPETPEAPDASEPEHEPDPQSRSGKARERQRRRRERQAGTETSRRGPAQINPPRSVTLPRFNLALTRGRLLLFIGGAAAFIVVVIALIGQLKEPEAVLAPNAVWLGTGWTYELQELDDIDDLAARLQDFDIGTVYAWVSWLQEDGSWRGAENFGAVGAFAKGLKNAYPESRVLGWVSFPVNMGENNYRLDDETLQQDIADFSARVVNDLGFDGVFLNVEPVWDGDENFLALLRKVRASVGENVPIAVAVPPDWSPVGAGIPVPPLIVPGTIWTTEYKQSVALLVDEMAIMAYNSGLGDADDYAAWTAYQVKAFAGALDPLGEGTVLVLGIPTYDAEPPGHDPAVENIRSAVRGVLTGLEQAGAAARLVRGLAIYADWTTDDTEWQQFRADWVNR